METIIILLFISFIILICSILLMKSIKSSYSIEKCSNICINFIKIIFMAIVKSCFEQKPIEYPVYIGNDSIDIIPQNVNYYFKDLLVHFETGYFLKYNNNNQNFLIYEFEVLNPKTNDISYIEFLELLIKICEGILIQYWRDCGYNTNNIYINNFIAVQMINTRLFIYIAKNNIGKENIKLIRQKVQHNYYASQHNAKPEELETEWHNSDNKGEE